MEAPQIFEQDSLRRHGFAVLTMSFGLALQLWMGNSTGPHAPLLLALSVTVGAWYGGLGPGLLATGLGGLILAYFVIPPLYSFQIEGTGGWLHLSAFACVGILVSLLCETRRRSAQTLSAALARERSGAAEAAILARENAWLQTELARAQSDLDYFTEAIRSLPVPTDLLDYAEATRIHRCETVNCAALLESAIAQTGAAVAHDPLPAIRGSESHLRALFVRLIRNAQPGCRVTAGYQGDGWTFRVSHTQCDAIAARIVEGHGGTVEARAGIVRFHIPRR